MVASKRVWIEHIPIDWRITHIHFIQEFSFAYYYVGRSNQRGTKAVTQRPFDLQPCTWCLLKRTLGLYNGPKSQINSSYYEKLASDLLKAVLPPPTPLRDWSWLQQLWSQLQNFKAAKSWHIKLSNGLEFLKIGQQGLELQTSEVENWYSIKTHSGSFV